MTDFITDFMTWVGQFVVVSTILMVATHLFAKKRRAQKRHAEMSTEERGDSKEEPKPLEAASVS